jgi:osmoprotectant transport system ATP-binding protein
VDLAVARGETVALIGESGSGKSTLLRLMLGLVAPDAGEVRFDGAPVPADDPAFRRRVGYVVQGGALFPHLTGAGNASLVARHLRWPPERIARRLGELAVLTRLPEGALGRFPHALSGGQAQRVSLARALFLDPELLLLDEPLGALDPLTRADLQLDLRRAFDDLGKTVVFVTHDLAEAAFFARRLVLLRDGRVVQEGALEDLARAPAEPFVARFVAAQRRLALPAEGPA